jgi:hypothetical protein
MKLCPLFDSIQMPYRQRLEPPASFYDGLVAANAKLPREAIEAAIEEVEYSVEVTLSESQRKYLAKVVKQLRAMLPEEEK